jgi:hypothetical protein
MTIKVNTVEGKTIKAGSKQGRTYQIIEELSVKGFFKALTDNGKKMTIWNLKGDWSKIGICNDNCMRYSYSTDFQIF